MAHHTLPPRGGKGRDGGVAADDLKAKKVGEAQPSRDPRLKGVDIFERATYTPQAATQARRLRNETTLSEKMLWNELRKLKLHIRRQAPIGRFIADFAHHGARLVIEVDGPHHDFDDAQLHDVERDAWLRAEGFEVFRVRDGDALERSEEIATQIAALILSRGDKGSAAPSEAAPTHSAATPPSPTLPPSRGKGEIY